MSFYQYSESAVIGITFAFTCVLVIGWVGNILVCIVIFRTKKMHTPMNYLVVNLAVADMIVITFIAPRYVLDQAFPHPKGSLGDYTCKFLTGEVLTWTGSFASGFSLTCIAFERYFAVTNPHNSKRRLTHKKLKIIIPVSWLFAFVGNLPLFLYSKYDENYEFCNFFWPTPDFPKYHSVIGTFVMGVIPIGLMFYVYSRLICALWLRPADTTTASQRAILKHRRRTTRMVITVSLMYCFCWIPDFVVYISSSFREKPLYSAIHITVIMLVTMNSALNPLVYSFQSEPFRRHLAVIVCCLHTRGNRVVPLNTELTRTNEMQPAEEQSTTAQVERQEREHEVENM